MTRAIRLMQLIELLNNGRGYTTAELAARFQVSQRTIQDDLLLLQGEPFYLALEPRHEWRIVAICRGE